MKKYLTLLLCSLCALACFSASAESTAGLKDVNVVISTTKGDIELALYPSKAPVTVANFLNLASRGYYKGITFHRVIPNFMIQGGGFSRDFVQKPAHDPIVKLSITR